MRFEVVVFLLEETVCQTGANFPGDAPLPGPFPDCRVGAAKRERGPGQARGPAEAGKGRCTHAHSHLQTRQRKSPKRTRNANSKQAEGHYGDGPGVPLLAQHPGTEAEAGGRRLQPPRSEGTAMRSTCQKSLGQLRTQRE